MEAKPIFSLDFVDLEESELENIKNDSQLSSSGTIVVPGPYVNEESCTELDLEASEFTQKSNEWFYRVSNSELEFIAAQVMATSTKDQTKWAIKIIRGKS